MTVAVSACGGETERLAGASSPPAAASRFSATSPSSAQTTARAASPTASPVARRSAASTGALPPLPSAPPLPVGASVVATGQTPFALAPGQTRLFDPAELAKTAGRAAPPCSSLVWMATWRASDPLNAAFVQQEERTELGRGRWGSVMLGCSSLELRADTANDVNGELVFTIAAR